MKILSSKRSNCILLFYCFTIATLFLSVCSKSSFRFPMNDWVDVHCFFTVGRSIWDGLVPYRDLYEQKGPVLYFLYAIAALFSSDSFWGVFLLEIICFGLFLYYSAKIAALYLGDGPASYAIAAVLAAVIPVSPAFAHGSGAEEFCLFMLSYSMYSVLLALHEDRALSFREAFLNGIFAAAVLYVKFTILGFYIGLALFVFVWYIAKAFSPIVLLKTIGQFLLGIAALSIPVWGYFLLNGAADDLYTVYFYNNLVLYPNEVEGSRWDLIKNCLKTTITNNRSYGWMIYMSLLFMVAHIRERWLDLAMGLLSFVGLAIGTYWGGRGYTYYGLIIAPFAVFGLVGLVQLSRVIPLRKWLQALPFGASLIQATALFVVVTMLFSYTYRNSRNAYLMAYEKEDLPAYQFAEIIKTVENPKILNYGFLDGGFYYAADVEPTCKFFCTLNINAPDMWAMQRECIENGEVDFVITRHYTLNRYSPRADAYELVDQATFWFEGVDFTYYLYQKTTN